MPFELSLHSLLHKRFIYNCVLILLFCLLSILVRLSPSFPCHTETALIEITDDDLLKIVVTFRFSSYL